MTGRPSASVHVPRSRRMPLAPSRAEQGVLLLNNALTVEEGKAAAFYGHEEEGHNEQGPVAAQVGAPEPEKEAVVQKVGGRGRHARKPDWMTAGS